MPTLFAKAKPALKKRKEILKDFLRTRTFHVLCGLLRNKLYKTSIHSQDYMPRWHNLVLRRIAKYLRVLMITAHYALIRCPKGFVGSKTPLRARQTLWFESPILGVF